MGGLVTLTVIVIVIRIGLRVSTFQFFQFCQSQLFQRFGYYSITVLQYYSFWFSVLFSGVEFCSFFCLIIKGFFY